MAFEEVLSFYCFIGSWRCIFFRFTSWDLIILQSHPKSSRDQPGIGPQGEKVQGWYPDLLRNRQEGCSWWGACILVSPGSMGGVLCAGFWPLRAVAAALIGSWCPLLRQGWGAGLHHDIIGEPAPHPQSLQGAKIDRKEWWGVEHWRKQQLVLRLPWSLRPTLPTPDPLRTQSTELCAH